MDRPDGLAEGSRTVNRLLAPLTFGLMMAFGGAASADALVHSGTGEGTTNDLLDVSRGTIVTSSSAMGFNAGISSDPRSAFGYFSYFIEPTHVVFENDGVAGVTVDFINFQAAAPVALRYYELRLADDSNATPFPDRGTVQFRLLGGTSPGSLNLLSQASILANYTVSYGSSEIVVSDPVNGVGMQYFRLELVRATSQGPRLIEFDGFSAVPEPASVILAGVGLSVVGFAGWRLRRRHG
jgi:hypothetical protein